MTRILMGTDLSVRSDRALQRALVLAHELGLELHIVHVVDDTLPDSVVERQEVAAREAIEGQLAALQLASEVAPAVHVVRGQEFAWLAGKGGQADSELVILGDHRHSIVDMFRGTTVERVVRFGDRPVLVVKSVVTAPYRKVLVAADLSVHSKAALSMAARIAPQSDIEILHACQESFPGFLSQQDRSAMVKAQQVQFEEWLRGHVDEITTNLGAKAPGFRLTFRVGNPLNVIHQHAQDNRPDLIALGTHGRSGVAHAIVGSVAEHLLSEATIDVLAVKAGNRA